jgi:energy-coupling factor transport system substrate-specific component
MSSDPHSDAPSPAADSLPADAAPEPPSDAELIRERGADLLDALEARLPGSIEHAEATASWALAIAAELGVSRDTALAVRETARLHGIGLIYAEAELAARDEAELTDDERRRLDDQAGAAARLAAGADLPGTACVWLEHSREHFEGGGPKRLYGGAIPLESRIIRAACAYAGEIGGGEPDYEAALERLGARAGTELDPATIGAIAFVLDRSAGKTGG